VPQAELHSLYAGARVFCLPSRCESFGIPAVEAQAFGTPAVVAAGTAAPEIVGQGGVAVTQDDVEATAQALLRYLGADSEWRQCSRAARANAERFHWRGCSTPLLDAIEKLGAQASGS
jgi:glycosyltransferase involved in cell wall biosynthesis